MHLKTTFRIAVAVAPLLACSPLLAQNAPLWRFSPGKELRYQVTQTTAMNVDAGEAGDFVTDTSQTLDVTWRIDDVDDEGVATGVQRIDRIQLNITMPSGLELAFDSQTEEAASGLAAMLTPLFESLLENEVTIKVSPTGEVIECEMPGPMVERLARVPATRSMSYLVTGAGVRQVTEQIALPLPRDNESARRDLLVENRVLGTLRGDLAWAPADSDVAEIALFTPTALLAIEPAPAVDIEDSTQPQPIESPEITEQTVEGSAEFDIAAGRLKVSTLRFKFQIKGQLMGSDVVSDGKQTIEVTAK